MTAERLLTTSWDDGSPTDLALAGVLDEFGLLGTFYASTGPGGNRTIDDDGLRSIGTRHELGNHGRTHRLFTELSPAEIEAELEWGDAELSRFGTVARIVAPPKGRMSPSVVRTLSERGYHARSAPILGARHALPGVLEPTFHFLPHGVDRLVRNALRRRAVPAAPLLVAWGGAREFRERAQRLLRAGLDRFPCVHIWGHSEELERLGLWDVFSDVCATAVRLGARPATNSDALALLDRPPG